MRHAEPTDRCGAPPVGRREPDASFPSEAIPDEHIPGRLPFDLHLSRSNRLARAAYEATDRSRHSARGERPSAAGSWRPRTKPTDATWSLGTLVSRLMGAAPKAHPTEASLRLIATRRGSIIDVLA